MIQTCCLMRITRMMHTHSRIHTIKALKLCISQYPQAHTTRLTDTMQSHELLPSRPLYPLSTVSTLSLPSLPSLYPLSTLSPPSLPSLPSRPLLLTSRNSAVGLCSPRKRTPPQMQVQSLLHALLRSLKQAPINGNCLRRPSVNWVPSNLLGMMGLMNG